MSELSGQTIIVTGANSGIGKETAVELATRGARVVMLCRSPERGEAALTEVRARSGSSDVDLITGDLGSFESLDAFIEAFMASHGTLDVLVNNAGVYLANKRINDRGCEMHWAINHLGTAYLTLGLLDALDVAPQRIVTVSSMAHRFARLNLDDPFFDNRMFTAFQAYSDSKLANILFTAGLRQHFPAVESVCLHPGMIATNLSHSDPGLFSMMAKASRPFLSSAASGAKTQIWLASAEQIPPSKGFYYASSKPRTPSRAARSASNIDQLWTWTQAQLESSPNNR